MDKNFRSFKWWWSLWPKTYKFVLEPNDFEITKARKTFEIIDKGYRTAVRYGLWIAVFFLVSDLVLGIVSIATGFSSYRAYEPVLLNNMLLPYAIIVIVVCLTWRLIAIICGALLRLVELNENANRPKG